MIWCIMSMLLGALIFAAGIAFERLFLTAPRAEMPREAETEMDMRLYRQWENLLGYDGTEQEVIYDENR